MSEENPFAAPAESTVSTEVPRHGEPARRMQRLACAIADGLVLIAINIPVMMATGYWERAMQQQVTMAEQLGYSLFGVVIYMLINGYPLAKRGQSIGKMLGGIRIVDNDTGEILPLGRLYLLRMLPIQIANFIPIAGQVINLINALMIFGQERRCLHDRIANTKVVVVEKT